MMGECGSYLVHFCSTKNISSAMLDVIPSGLQVSMVTACRSSNTAAQEVYLFGRV